MAANTAAVIGATGLIGSHLLEDLIADKNFDTIKVIVRRPFTADHPKVSVLQIDFTDQLSYKNAIAGSDAVFCTIGTTQKKVKGDKDAYRKVDYDIIVNAAKLSAASGVNKFLFVSSVGANRESDNFYLKLKGEIEDAVQNCGIPSVSIFRPSVLLGKRKEFRLIERLAQGGMQVFSFLIPSKYKPISAEIVAKAMITASKLARQGVAVYHYGEIRELGGF
jgi:uncharacterized protein YbjT (DUF2867 family)